MHSEWRTIPGYDGAYEISIEGQVRGVNRVDAAGRRWRGRLLKRRLSTAGYWKVVLTKNGKKRTHSIHRMVLEVFDGPPPEPNLLCAHIDGSRTNNVLHNLMWATPKENMAHKVLHQTVHHAVGEGKENSKLCVEDVKRIRDARMFGAMYKDLASVYGVDLTTIRLAAIGRNWAHLGIKEMKRYSRWQR